MTARVPLAASESVYPVIFISHISEEAPVAHTLKDWIESTFPERCAVFVSSDIRDIPAGSRWLEEIEQALGAARVLLVVCSPLSLTRPWINVETGCALIKRVPVVPALPLGTATESAPRAALNLPGVGGRVAYFRE
jgi:hypothetical protein